MVNRHRGEVGAVLDGRPRVLVLTLGALAELEAAFGVGDLAGLAARFERGRLSAHDLSRILGAGLRGAGETVSDAEVAAHLATPWGVGTVGEGLWCDGGAAERASEWSCQWAMPGPPSRPSGR